MLTVPRRQNPAVMANAAKVFNYIAQALEAETLPENTAARVVTAAKLLINATGQDPNQLLLQLTPEAQHTVRAYFS